MIIEFNYDYLLVMIFVNEFLVFSIVLSDVYRDYTFIYSTTHWYKNCIIVIDFYSIDIVYCITLCIDSIDDCLLSRLISNVYRKNDIL